MIPGGELRMGGFLLQAAPCLASTASCATYPQIGNCRGAAKTKPRVRLAGAEVKTARRGCSGPQWGVE